MIHTAGLDIGSTYVKVAILDERLGLAATASILAAIALRTSSTIGCGNPIKFAGSSRNSGFDAMYAAFN